MVAIVYSLVILLNLKYAYKKKNNIFIVVLSSVLILLMMCGYRRPFYGDLDNYYYMYVGAQETTIGMKIIFNLFKALGFEFYTVHYAILIFLWIIILYFIREFCDNWHFPIMLMSIYYIIISADQIKNHSAYIFLCIALISIYKGKKIRFFVCLLIATTIHYSFIIYFLIILAFIKKVKNIMKFIIGMSMLLFLLALLNLDSTLINFFTNNLGNYLQVNSMVKVKLETYLTSRTNYGFLLCVIFQFLNYFLLKYSKNILIAYGNVSQVDMVNFALKINGIGFIIFPLFVYNMQWYRIIRDLLLLNYCIYGNAYHCMYYNWRKRMLFLSIIIISVIFWLIGDLCLKTALDLVLIPFFTNNIYF